MNPEELSNITRRHFFGQIFGKALGIGIGSAALATLLEENGLAQSSNTPQNANLARSLGAHPFDFAPKAKNVIYLEQVGGVTHVDLFDHKPALIARDQEPIPESFLNGERFAFITGTPKLQKSPFTFKQYGESGMWLSELVPHHVQDRGRRRVHSIDAHHAIQSWASPSIPVYRASDSWTAFVWRLVVVWYWQRK